MKQSPYFKQQNNKKKKWTSGFYNGPVTAYHGLLFMAVMNALPPFILKFPPSDILKSWYYTAILIFCKSFSILSVQHSTRTLTFVPYSCQFFVFHFNTNYFSQCITVNQILIQGNTADCHTDLPHTVKWLHSYQPQTNYLWRQNSWNTKWAHPGMKHVLCWQKLSHRQWIFFFLVLVWLLR